MKPVETMSRKEFAAYIYTLMTQNEIDVILSGGSCVSIYSDETYLSADLDFIRTAIGPFQRVRRVMIKNGFIEENRYFKHPDSRFYVEFPGGPPTIGEDPIREFTMLDTECGSLKLLTPTDCVKDRLCAFYHWNDQEAFQQALMVAASQTINIDDIKAWSGRESKSDLFQVFLDQYRQT